MTEGSKWRGMNDLPTMTKRYNQTADDGKMVYQNNTKGKKYGKNIL